MKYFAAKMQSDLTVYTSHRNEILSVADFSLIEPNNAKQRLPFILSMISAWGLNALHTGRNCQWFENHRAEIEASGVSLTISASGPQWLEIADGKVTFAEVMEENNLPAVPSLRINSIKELQHQLSCSPFEGQQLCVKPVTGIYGMGFCRFDDTVSNHPENRVVHPRQYLAALSGAEMFTPLVLMPYLPGPEYSVDILAAKGEVLAAVARRKEGTLQYLENSSEAFELACACARTMKADCLINVQTRNNLSGAPVLLETNMRPSGGIGYTQHCEVNLPGLYAFHKLGLMSKSDVIEIAKSDFVPATVRALTDVIAYPTHLTNRLN